MAAHASEMSTQSVIVAVDAETFKRLRAAARTERATLADVIREAISAHLNAPTRKER
jgi:Ribbon-helix-helix protein, copG family